MKTFNIATKEGPVEVEYKRQYTFLGRKFALHRPYPHIDDLWSLSDYLTGMLVQNGFTIRETLAGFEVLIKVNGMTPDKFAELISKYPVINEAKD